MPFQTTVNFFGGAGVIGEWAFEGPSRVQPGILRSTSADNNVIGRVFTYLDPTDPTLDRVMAAGTEGTGFGGILVNPKVYASYGTTSGTLEPTLTLPNETQAEFAQMGFLWVSLATAADIGAAVFYNADGSLTTVDTGNPVPNCTVYSQTTTVAGLTIIKLTN